MSSDLSHTQLVRLALSTIGSFDFGPMSLLEFARDHITPFLDETDKDVRKVAALACCR
jgi:FKBP12-rapamycin complex-associated protein